MSKDDSYHELLYLLGKNLKKIRRSRSLTQKEVSADCGMDEQNYRRIENGKTNPTLKSLHRISEALDVSLTDMLTANSKKNVTS